jgi:hypothetical protein
MAAGSSCSGLLPTRAKTSFKRAPHCRQISMRAFVKESLVRARNRRQSPGSHSFKDTRIMRFAVRDCGVIIPAASFIKDETFCSM